MDLCIQSFPIEFCFPQVIVMLSTVIYLDLLRSIYTVRANYQPSDGNYQGFLGHVLFGSTLSGCRLGWLGFLLGKNNFSVGFVVQLFQPASNQVETVEKPHA